MSDHCILIQAQVSLQKCEQDSESVAWPGTPSEKLANHIASFCNAGLVQGGTYLMPEYRQKVFSLKLWFLPPGLSQLPLATVSENQYSLCFYCWSWVLRVVTVGYGILIGWLCTQDASWIACTYNQGPSHIDMTTAVCRCNSIPLRAFVVLTINRRRLYKSISFPLFPSRLDELSHCLCSRLMGCIVFSLECNKSMKWSRNEIQALHKSYMGLTSQLKVAATEALRGLVHKKPVRAFLSLAREKNVRIE